MWVLGKKGMVNIDRYDEVWIEKAKADDDSWSVVAVKHPAKADCINFHSVHILTGLSEEDAKVVISRMQEAILDGDGAFRV